MHTEQDIDQAIHQISGGRVLDIATGAGGCLTWMKDTLKDWDEMIGVDNIDHRREGQPSIFDGERIRFMPMDAHHLDFADASFDTVTISNSVHHMTDPKQVLSEMMRVLKPGGHLIISEMVSDHLTAEQQTHALIHHWWADIDLALGIPHYATYTRQQLIEMAQEIGLNRCDLYDYADLTSDAHDAEQTEFLRGHIRRYLDRAKDLPNFADLQARGEAIDRRIDEIGFRGATLLIVIGEK